MVAGGGSAWQLRHQNHPLIGRLVLKSDRRLVLFFVVFFGLDSDTLHHLVFEVDVSPLVWSDHAGRRCGGEGASERVRRAARAMVEVVKIGVGAVQRCPSLAYIDLLCLQNGPSMLQKRVLRQRPLQDGLGCGLFLQNRFAI